MRIKNKLWLVFAFLITSTVFAQVKQPSFPDSLFSTYYHQRVALFRALPQTKGDIIFLGNSITDGGEWNELFNDLKVKNRGVSSDRTISVLNRLDEVYSRNPAKVFLLIGINDLARNVSVDSVVKNIIWIAELIKEKSPQTKLYVQSIFPVNESFGMFGGHTKKKTEILQVNKALFDSAVRYHYNYVDVFSALTDSTGRLNTAYTNDGLHLTGAGYVKWKETIYDKVYDLPSLIPLPQKITWINNKFLLSQCRSILIADISLKTEAVLVQKLLGDKEVSIPVKLNAPKGEMQIELRKELFLSVQNNNEAYSLLINKNGILIKAATSHGFFNAIQTLSQLIVNKEVQACEIIDWPAFEWRGFMVDVGRNYQSMKQLKQQIDAMAAYKLNIFHFHLTEDIAWRLQSKRYPQLTGSKFMIRNPGKFYSIEEMKELIAYCKARYITLIPEIDMPGHSAAFKRAMGFDMQREEGVKICKNILIELCQELDVPYVHIGGDEVKIINKDFLTQMIALLKSFNKKVIAWDPGGNVPEGTIMQMWNGATVPKDKFPAVDSRHLYLNHFDPIDGVVATFNHQVCDVPVGDENKLGAILCNWPDRRVEKEENLIKMNAVYPVMLSFSERCWRGGGRKNYLSDIGTPSTERYNAFVEFENRLLVHKEINFTTASFPYVKQSDIEWKLIGPFKNKGKTETVFAPELNSFWDTAQLKNYASLFGGTIWLRHFWHPMIQSHLQNPEDSTTYYAVRKIWCDEAGVKSFWIGFNNISRSTATDSPPPGKWDEKNSTVWVNGKLILPPVWKRGGQKGNSEIPLIDEGYEYREPAKVFLTKGWNVILIKAPVGSFQGNDWQNPVKWMFTFVEVK
ncbi:MAG: family 20 glycosylhydrolase [Chitinophagaceae bacterium]